MKFGVVVLAALLLAGCGRWFDMDSDAFSPGYVSQEQYVLDMRACHMEAEAVRSYSVSGINAPGTNRHNIYSEALMRCMKARGYSKRTSWYNYWEGYRM